MINTQEANLVQVTNQIEENDLDNQSDQIKQANQINQSDQINQEKAIDGVYSNRINIIKNNIEKVNKDDKEFLEHLNVSIKKLIGEYHSKTVEKNENSKIQQMLDETNEYFQFEYQLNQFKDSSKIIQTVLDLIEFQKQRNIPVIALKQPLECFIEEDISYEKMLNEYEQNAKQFIKREYINDEKVQRCIYEELVQLDGQFEKAHTQKEQMCIIQCYIYLIYQLKDRGFFMNINYIIFKVIQLLNGLKVTEENSMKVIQDCYIKLYYVRGYYQMNFNFERSLESFKVIQSLLVMGFSKFDPKQLSELSRKDYRDPTNEVISDLSSKEFDRLYTENINLFATVQSSDQFAKIAFRFLSQCVHFEINLKLRNIVQEKLETLFKLKQNNIPESEKYSLDYFDKFLDMDEQEQSNAVLLLKESDKNVISIMNFYSYLHMYQNNFIVYLNIDRSIYLINQSKLFDYGYNVLNFYSNKKYTKIYTDTLNKHTDFISSIKETEENRNDLIYLKNMQQIIDEPLLQIQFPDQKLDVDKSSYFRIQELYKKLIIQIQNYKSNQCSSEILQNLFNISQNKINQRMKQYPFKSSWIIEDDKQEYLIKYFQIKYENDQNQEYLKIFLQELAYLQYFKKLQKNSMDKTYSEIKQYSSILTYVTHIIGQDFVCIVMKRYEQIDGFFKSQMRKHGETQTRYIRKYQTKLLSAYNNNLNKGTNHTSQDYVRNNNNIQFYKDFNQSSQKQYQLTDMQLSIQEFQSQSQQNYYNDRGEFSNLQKNDRDHMKYIDSQKQTSLEFEGIQRITSENVQVNSKINQIKEEEDYSDNKFTEHEESQEQGNTCYYNNMNFIEEKDYTEESISNDDNGNARNEAKNDIRQQKNQYIYTNDTQKHSKKFLKFKMLLCLIDCFYALRINKIIHKDIKPQNIVKTQDNNPLLIDYGISEQYVEKGFKSSIGTKEYKSLEQEQGKPLGWNTDLTGIIITIYEILTKQKISSHLIDYIIQNIRKELGMKWSNKFINIIANTLNCRYDFMKSNVKFFQTLQFEIFVKIMFTLRNKEENISFQDFFEYIEQVSDGRLKNGMSSKGQEQNNKQKYFWLDYEMLVEMQNNEVFFLLLTQSKYFQFSTIYLALIKDQALHQRKEPDLAQHSYQLSNNLQQFQQNDKKLIIERYQQIFNDEKQLKKQIKQLQNTIK